MHARNDVRVFVLHSVCSSQILTVMPCERLGNRRAKLLNSNALADRPVNVCSYSFICCKPVLAGYAAYFCCMYDFMTPSVVNKHR